MIYLQLYNTLYLLVNVAINPYLNAQLFITSNDSLANKDEFWKPSYEFILEIWQKIPIENFSFIIITKIIEIGYYEQVYENDIRNLRNQKNIYILNLE